MKEHIKIFNEFKENPYRVLENDKDTAKLISAINKSIKMMQKAESRKSRTKSR